MAKQSARNGTEAQKKRDEECLARKASGESVNLDGQGGIGDVEEPIVTYEKVDSEIVLPRKNTHWGRHRIAFGRDRHTREALSGYGGRGCTAAGSIDIVVGSGGPEPKAGTVVGPNFFTDAARIYLTQRGDIDRYFNLSSDDANGILPSENRSAIGIKADAVRIIGREGVRIYTNARTKGSGKVEETTSQGGNIQSHNGIHLIANCSTGVIGELDPTVQSANLLYGGPFNKVQPMVRGDLLVAFLKDLIEDIQNLSDAVNNFAMYQLKYNTRIAEHSHTVASATPGVAVPDFASLIPGSASSTIKIIQDTLVKNSLNVANMKIATQFNWLEASSPLCILSPNNKTN